jgi:hypothetical protein
MTCQAALYLLFCCMLAARGHALIQSTRRHCSDVGGEMKTFILQPFENPCAVVHSRGYRSEAAQMCVFPRHIQTSTEGTQAAASSDSSHSTPEAQEPTPTTAAPPADDPLKVILLDAATLLKDAPRDTIDEEQPRSALWNAFFNGVDIAKLSTELRPDEESPWPTCLAKTHESSSVTKFLATAKEYCELSGGDIRWGCSVHTNAHGEPLSVGECAYPLCALPAPRQWHYIDALTLYLNAERHVQPGEFNLRAAWSAPFVSRPELEFSEADMVYPPHAYSDNLASTRA